MRIHITAGVLSVLLAACAERDHHTPPNPPHELVDTGDPPAKPVVEGSDQSLPHESATVESPLIKSADNTEAHLAKLRSASVVGARPISSRTLSLKVWLEGGIKAVFKPLRARDKRAPREVAVYRMSRLLGVGIVPASSMRQFPLHLLVSLTKKQHPEEAATLADTASTDNRGAVQGAIIEWIEDLDSNRLEEIGGRRAIRSWLAPARKTIDKEPPLAANAAAMIAFDYVMGNWDRFSGGNVFASASGNDLVLLDHNASFAPWSDRQKERMEKLLARTERFPASLITRLRNLAPSVIETALAAEPWHEKNKLLNDSDIKLLLGRRDRLIEHVDKLIALHGEGAVLPFP